MARFGRMKAKRFSVSTRIFGGRPQLWTPGIKRPRVRRKQVEVRGVQQMVKP